MKSSRERRSGAAFVITHESDPHRRDKSISVIALAISRSLGRQGIPVVRIHPNRLDYSLLSKYCSDISISPDMYESDSALVDHLVELASQYEGKRVLIPASDDTAQFLGEHKHLLKDVYEICVAERETMRIMVNKKNQYDYARRLGVPIPETYFPSDLAEVAKLSEQVNNFPYIIKPLVAHTWRLASMQGISKGRKAVRVDTPKEMRQACLEMGEGCRDVMVQEVIGGRDEELFTFLGYISANGTPLAYCVRRKIRQFPIDFGYCTMTVSCHNDVIVDQSIRLLRGMGFSGICGVEYKFDRKTGENKLIEINPRPVSTIGLAPACGVDIPYVAYMDLSGAKVEPITEWRDDVTWYRIWSDLLAVRQLRGRGGPSLLKWANSLRGELTEGVFSMDDPKPAWSYYSDILGTELKKQIQKRIAWRGRITTAARLESVK